LHRAAAISRILELQETTAATFQAVIDGLATPVLILREDLSIVHVNGRAEALLAAGGALRRRQGRLSLRDRGGEAQLARAVRNDTAPGAVGREAIALQTESGSRLLHVLRLEDRLGRATARGAAVFVTSASPQPGSTGESMAQVFRLTPQEARVLALIGAGRSPGEAAAALKVRLSTVRTHLLRIFAKTGVSRQAELVRLFAAFQPPI
jgi:DNA-binding CsgD family transcriptional regulator